MDFTQSVPLSPGAESNARTQQLVGTCGSISPKHNVMLNNQECLKFSNSLEHLINKIRSGRVNVVREE